MNEGWRVRVVDLDGNTISGPDEVVAEPYWWDARKHAECAAEEYWHACSPDYPTDVRVVVTDPGGAETRWDVEVVAVPDFHAREAS